MVNLHNLTVAELREAVAIKEKIEALESELASVIGAESDAEEPAAPGRRKRRHMSAAARARIGAAQRARWAKARKATRAAARAAAPAKKKKRKVSAAARARLSAAAKARWARVKASGASRL